MSSSSNITPQQSQKQQQSPSTSSQLVFPPPSSPAQQQVALQPAPPPPAPGPGPAAAVGPYQQVPLIISSDNGNTRSDQQTVQGRIEDDSSRIDLGRVLLLIGGGVAMAFCGCLLAHHV